MENELTIDGVIVLGLEIVIDGDHTNSDIDLGALFLQADGRECILDTVQSYRTFQDGETRIRVDLASDKETFHDSKNDLKATDLVDGMDAKFYYSCIFNWESCTLFVKDGGCTKAITVELDE